MPRPTRDLYKIGLLAAMKTVAGLTQWPTNSWEQMEHLETSLLRLQSIQEFLNNLFDLRIRYCWKPALFCCRHQRGQKIRRNEHFKATYNVL